MCTTEQRKLCKQLFSFTTIHISPMAIYSKPSLFVMGTLFVVHCISFIGCIIGQDSIPEGIDIPYITTTTACDPALQPQLVPSNFTRYAFLLSPKPTQLELMKNQTSFNCTWIVEAEKNQTLIVIIQSELIGVNFIELYDSDNRNNDSNKIARFSGVIRRASLQTKSNKLFIHYSGLVKLADISIFKLYIKQSQPQALCINDTDVKCRNGIHCVPASQQCDDVDDCGDGTDEENCTDILVMDDRFAMQCGVQSFINTPDNSSPLQIVGGKASRPGAWPWIVSMRLVDEEPNGHTCGGSIINRRWIITAAHCVVLRPNITSWTINAGKYQKLVPEQTEVVRYVKRMIPHPQYIGSWNEPEPKDEKNNRTWYDYNANDIALIELNAPLPKDNVYINAICLANNSFPIFPGLLSYVIGWGETYNTGAPFLLKEAIVPVISNSQCHKWMPMYDIGPKMLCAGYEQGGQDSCKGDSGGPLFVYNENITRYDLIGIVSTGDECAAKREAGIYTRVPSFVDWIANVTETITFDS